MKKKKWGKPELIIITRSQLEESVLYTCKYSQPVRAGPGDINGICIIPVSYLACESFISS